MWKNLEENGVLEKDVFLLCIVHLPLFLAQEFSTETMVHEPLLHQSESQKRCPEKETRAEV